MILRVEFWMHYFLTQYTMKYAFYFFILFSWLLATLKVDATAFVPSDICIRENGSLYFLLENRHRSSCRKHERAFSLQEYFTAGKTWPMWPVGPVWATGATWAIWPQGIPGEKGDQWVPWEHGATGSIGPIWPKGDPGPRWEIWPKGDVGETGPAWPSGLPWVQGIQWEKGEQWNPWEKWEMWPRGEPWVPWIPGIDGRDGRDGVSGYEVVYSEISADDELQKTVVAFCPIGKWVIGGGFLTHNVSNSNEVVITRNYPANFTTWEVKWWVDGSTSADESFSLQAYAICILSEASNP